MDTKKAERTSEIHSHARPFGELAKSAFRKTTSVHVLNWAIEGATAERNEFLLRVVEPLPPSSNDCIVRPDQSQFIFLGMLQKTSRRRVGLRRKCCGRAFVAAGIGCVYAMYLKMQCLAGWLTRCSASAAVQRVASATNEM